MHIQKKYMFPLEIKTLPWKQCVNFIIIKTGLLAYKTSDGTKSQYLIFFTAQNEIGP